MFLNDAFLGSLFLDGSQITTSNSYDKITINGVIIVNYIKIIDYVMTDAQLDAITLNDTVVWDSDTLFWASFTKSTLDAGNIISLSDAVTSWNIKRLEQNATSLVDIATVDASITEYCDLTTTSNRTFTYFVFPQSASQVGVSLMTNTVTTNWYHWSLTDVSTQEVYVFDFNVTSGQVSNVIDRTEFTTYTRFNKVNKGIRDFYKNTSFKALAGYFDSSGNYLCPNSYIEALKTMINRNSTKYLKDRSGNLMVVDTYDFQKQVEDEIYQNGIQPVDIQFSYMEIDNPPN